MTTQMIPVVSSNIAAVGHDSDKSQMTVQFLHGKAYTYDNVTADVFQSILHAESVGKAFIATIKKNPTTYPVVTTSEPAHV